MRLIDADELLKYANGEITSAFAYPQGQRADDEKAYREMWSNIRKILLSAPTIEAEPIKHGKWRHYEGTLTCSVCHTEIYDDIMELLGDDVPRYCPNCGADMREVAE